MIADLKPFSTYKASGVPWLAQVPGSWRVIRTKFLFGEKDQRAGDKGGVLLSLTRARGLLPQTEASKRIASVEDLSNYRVCQPGDLVMNRMQAWSGMFAVSSCDGVVSPDYSVFEATVPSEVKFFEHLFKTPLLMAQFALRSKGIGSGFNRLYTDDFGDVPVPVPTLLEQTAIVRYLDHVDRRIQRYIRAKQKLSALLEEQKQAVIHQAVTGRIDVRTGRPYPAYKDSSVEWLGKVPEHWRLRRLKWVTRLQRGYDLPADRRVPGPFPVVSSGGFIGTHSESRCTGPGVVMGRYGSTDAVFYVTHDFWPHNTSLFVTHFQGNVQKWCYYLLRSITKADHAGKSAVPGLDRNDLFKIVVPVPLVGEQRDVVRAIEVATHYLDDAISAAHRQINLLQEHRTRLIADVVTGKLDVREAAARLPDEREEPPEPCGQAAGPDSCGEAGGPAGEEDG